MYTNFFQNDVVNQTIFDLTFEDDRHNLYNILQNAGATADTTQQVTRGANLN